MFVWVTAACTGQPDAERIGVPIGKVEQRTRDGDPMMNQCWTSVVDREGLILVGPHIVVEREGYDLGGRGRFWEGGI